MPKSGEGTLSPWRDFGANPYAAPFYYYINGVKQTALGKPTFGAYSNNGRLYEASSVKAWYPSTGYRDFGRVGVEGIIGGVGYQGFSWASSVSGTNGYFLYFNSDYLNPSYVGGHSHGFPVRCLRE